VTRRLVERLAAELITLHPSPMMKLAEYHRAVASRLRCEPDLLERARERVRAWREGGQLHPEYAAA
jgi:hypothetical protein